MKYVGGYWIPDDDHNLVLDFLGPGGEHDNQVFAEIRKYTKDQPKRTMVDIGANVGRWCKEFCCYCYRSKKIRNECQGCYNVS